MSKKLLINWEKGMHLKKSNLKGFGEIGDFAVYLGSSNIGIKDLLSWNIIDIIKYDSEEEMRKEWTLD